MYASLLLITFKVLLKVGFDKRKAIEMRNKFSWHVSKSFPLTPYDAKVGRETLKSQVYLRKRRWIKWKLFVGMIKSGSRTALRSNKKIIKKKRKEDSFWSNIGEAERYERD